MRISKEVSLEPPPFEKYKIIIEVESLEEERDILGLMLSNWNTHQLAFFDELTAAIRNE